MKTKHRLDLLMIVVPLILSAGASAQEGFAFGPPQDQVFMGALSVTSFGDLDGDGDQDLVGVPGLGGVIRLFDNDGSGQFSLTATLQAPGGTPGGGCVPVDLDGDGICEILYRSSFLSFLGGHFETYLGSHIAVYKQVGGVFVRNDYLVGADGPRFLVGDFDGDGDGDLLVGSGTFVPGDGVGGFLPPMTIALPGATTVESVGDIDQDGREDVAWLTNGTPRMLQIGFGRGLPQPGFDVLTVGYLPAIGNFPPAPQQGLLSGDVDGDGLLDVILTFSLPFPSPPTYHAANVVCRQRAPREFRIGPLAEGGLPHGQMSIFNLSADVDGDGRTDLLQYLNLLTPECLFSRGLTGGFLDTPVSVSISLTPNGIRHLVDVNGDGRADVINVFVSTASGTAMSTVTTFESLSVPVLKPLVAEVFGSPTLSGFIGHALPSQPTFRVRQAGGAPAAFEPLQFEVRTEGALTSTIAGQTDAQGFCVLPFPTGPLPSRHDVILRGASFDAVYQNIEVFESSAIIDSMPPIGPPYVALRFERSPSAGPMPLLLCADLPLPPPGFVPTAFGPIYTSLLQPGPAFGALDGVGLYGPADPALRAAPAYTLTSSIAGIQPGFSLVLQFIGFDPVPPYPDGLVLGPGLFLDF